MRTSTAVVFIGLASALLFGASASLMARDLCLVIYPEAPPSTRSYTRLRNFSVLIRARTATTLTADGKNCSDVISVMCRSA